MNNILLIFLFLILNTTPLTNSLAMETEEEEKENQEATTPILKRTFYANATDTENSEPAKKKHKVQAYEKQLHQLNMLLFKGIARNKLESAQEALRAGADINANICISQQKQPLYSALCIALLPKTTEQRTTFPLKALIPSRLAIEPSNSLDMLDFLLENGADPNRTTGPSYTSPIGIAAASNNCAAINSLISYGADINIPDIHGMLPIHTATREGFLKTLEVLLEWGTDINAQFKRSIQLLSFALYKGASFPTIALLLRYGATIDDQDIRGHQQLHRTLHKLEFGPLIPSIIDNNTTDALKILKLFAETCKEKALIHSKQRVLPFALSIASGRGQDEIASFIVVHFTKYLTQNERSQAFYSAVLNNRLAIAKLLYKYLDSSSATQINSSFIVASTHGHNDIIVFLLDHRNQITITTATLQKALARCAYAYNLKGMAILFNEVEAQDLSWLKAINRGLWLATLRGNRDIVAFILNQYDALSLNLDLRAITYQLLLLFKNKSITKERKKKYTEILNLLVSSARKRYIRQTIFNSILRHQAQEGIPQPIPPQLTYMPREILEYIASYLT